MHLDLKRKYEAQYNFFVPVSRPWAVDGLVKNINQMVLPRRLVNLIIYVDTDDTLFYNSVVDKFKKIHRQKRFALLVTYKTGNKSAGDSILERRQRIIEIWKKFQKALPPVPYTFAMEDDTQAPKEAFERLLYHIKQPSNIYASGIQMHRQSNSFGAWNIDQLYAASIQYDPKYRVQSIQGGGFYCFMVRTEDIKKAKFRQAGPAFGPDVCFVYDLKKKYKFTFAVADFHVLCGHLISPNQMIYPWHPELVGRLRYRITGPDDQELVEGGNATT